MSKLFKSIFILSLFLLIPNTGYTEDYRVLAMNDNYVSEIDIDKIKKAATDYYNNKGMWAGKFTLASIEKIRIEGTGPVIEAHIRYEYEPLPGNPREPGLDQRIFTIKVNGDHYEVIKMDAYMSATF